MTIKGVTVMNLKNKTVLFLGSFVTYGSAAGGISFADLMADKCGIIAVKEAVSGTTLADRDDSSYVSRLKKVDKSLPVDLFICQLSTNDATQGIATEEIEKAIRFIIEYVQHTFACPVVFYTGTYYESEAYAGMINLLYSLKNEYEFYILDLYHDEEMLSVSKEDYARYMYDPIHPNLIGYKEWWTPKFIDFCEQLPMISNTSINGIYRKAIEFCLQKIYSVKDKKLFIPDDLLSQINNATVSIESTPYYCIIKFFHNGFSSDAFDSTIVVQVIRKCSPPIVFLMGFKDNLLCELEYYKADSSEMFDEELFVGEVVIT